MTDLRQRKAVFMTQCSGGRVQILSIVLQVAAIKTILLASGLGKNLAELLKSVARRERRSRCPQTPGKDSPVQHQQSESDHAHAGEVGPAQPLMQKQCAEKDGAGRNEQRHE